MGLKTFDPNQQKHFAVTWRETPQRSFKQSVPLEGDGHFEGRRLFCAVREQAVFDALEVDEQPASMAASGVGGDGEEPAADIGVIGQCHGVFREPQPRLLKQLFSNVTTACEACEKAEESRAVVRIDRIEDRGISAFEPSHPRARSLCVRSMGAGLRHQGHSTRLKAARDTLSREIHSCVEGCMLMFMKEGGVATLAIVGFGLATLISALLFAYRPETHTVRFIVAMAVATVLAGLNGLVAGLASTLGYVTASEEVFNSPDMRRIVMIGIKESLASPVLALTLLTVAAFVTAMGVRRLPRS